MSKAEIIDLDEVRAQRRLANYRGKISGVIASNQKAISKLHDSGAMFSRDGARAGRDLLLAHQMLLRVKSLLETLGEDGMLPAPRNVEQIVKIYDELDTLLDKTFALTHRSSSYLSRLMPESGA